MENLSREKQIEEIAKIIVTGCNEGCCEECKHSEGVLYPDCVPQFTAEALYNAGYRKIVQCKDCEHFYQVGDVRICRHWNYHSTKDDAYCSFAKMKGGAE